MPFERATDLTVYGCYAIVGMYKLVGLSSENVIRLSFRRNG